MEVSAFGAGGIDSKGEADAANSVAEEHEDDDVADSGYSDAEDCGVMDRAFRMIREYQALRSYLEAFGRGRVLEQFSNFWTKDHRVGRHPFLPYEQAVADHMVL